MIDIDIYYTINIYIHIINIFIIYTIYIMFLDIHFYLEDINNMILELNYNFKLVLYCLQWVIIDFTYFLFK